MKYLNLFYMLLLVFSNLSLLRPSNSSLDERNIIDVPFFSQTELQEATDGQGNPLFLGNSSIPLWSDGCGVASLAMVFRKWGVDTCLECLNETLKETKAFSGALLSWHKPEAIAKAGAPYIYTIERINTNNPNSHKERVDKELAAGRPVIAFINSAHYVVITGKDEDGQYLINDPWKKSPEKGKNISIKNNLTGLGFEKITQFVYVYPEPHAPTNGMVVKGNIQKAYLQAGGSVGKFGNPVFEEIKYQDIYPFQEFEGGVIIDIDGKPVSIFNPIWKKVKAMGGFTETGLPINGEYTYHSIGRVIHSVDFQKLTMTWSDNEPNDKVDILYPENSFFVEYMDGANSEDQVIHTGHVRKINYNWETSRPIPWGNSDSFSIRWTKKADVSFFLGWFYTFNINTEGRYRLIIDGKTVIDGWSNQEKRKTTVHLGKGQHNFVLEFSKLGEKSSMQMNWSPFPTTPVFASGEADGPIDVAPASITEYINNDQVNPQENEHANEARNLDLSAPDAPVRYLVDSLSSGDVEKATITMAPGSRFWAKPLLNGSFASIHQQENLSTLEFAEMSYDVTMNGETKAVVTVDGLVKARNLSNELTSSEYFLVDISVEKIDGSWFIATNIAELTGVIQKITEAYRE